MDKIVVKNCNEFFTCKGDLLSYHVLRYSHARFSLFLQRVEMISCGKQQHTIDAVLHLSHRKWP